MKAVWNGVVIAESDNTVVIEDNHYFPVESLQMEYFYPTGKTSHCPWKGTANYYTVEVAGERNENAAWYYVEPLKAAANIRGCIAFWQGVEIVT